ncbi:MAG: hypothetical protein M1309_04220 [Actinobacteria bacterium]|nr:hypothetical protein [Actinomycetota bacterium]
MSHRFLRVFLVCHPPVKKEIINVIQREIPGGIKIECFFYMRSCLRVGNYDSNVSGAFSDVFVAQGSLMRPAALLHFFQHPFLDFRSKVRGIEFGHNGVDAFN